LKAFQYLAPDTIAEALDLLKQYQNQAKLLAGGTDLIVQMKGGDIQPDCVIDLKRIPELKRVRYNENSGLFIGALATATEIHSSKEVRLNFPAISDAAGVIGSVQIRNRASIGGNICRAAPSGDFAPILVALGAHLKLIGPKGERAIPVQDFFVGPGETLMEPDEILIEIRVPVPQAQGHAVYLRHSRRETLDLALVGVAVYIVVRPQHSLCEEVRIALGSVAPTPMRAKNAERHLFGRELNEELICESAKMAAEEAKPVSDVYGDAWYKKEIVNVLVRRALLGIMERDK
jgi:carbon-monoxide dehydrogenase medium subunit